MTFPGTVRPCHGPRSSGSHSRSSTGRMSAFRVPAGGAGPMVRTGHGWIGITAESIVSAMTRVTVNVGVLKVELDETDLRRLRRSRRTLFGGPCLVICRQWGRALDAGQAAEDGSRPVVWDTHALPWQQWLIERASDNNTVGITSLSAGLALAVEGADDRSPVVLRRPRSRDRSQRWHLEPTADGGAFVIENCASRKALDAAAEPHNGFEPHTWQPHGASWQQWVIARLPLGNPSEP